VRSFIVGTAGHIDHGKSALVTALTGTDPDRLKEEKERGITIDLGFAHAEIAPGVVGSFVDVPGHERFVRHMLAGAHGIDAVLLVVAADESVMPQTREHFEICRLLGVPRGVVALTKCDAADAETQAVAEAEVRELLRGSWLDGAPIVRVSARTGAGLPGLRAALASLSAGTPPRSEAGLLRLPVDRVFTLKGFGTVVTGTLTGGRLGVGDEVEILPSGGRARVRGLHEHGAAAESVGAGRRTAANLAGVEVDDAARGEVLAAPGTLRPATRLDVRLTLLAGAQPLADQERVRVHALSAEVFARVHQLGRSGLAQLRLEGPLVVVRGDRLVLRAYSPAATVGGAVVLDPQPPRRRAADRAALEALAAVADEGAAAEWFVAQAGARGLDAAELAARMGLTRAALLGLLEGRAGTLPLAEGSVYVSRLALDGLADALRAALTAFHAGNPLRESMSREELRRAVGEPHEAAFVGVLAALAAAGEAKSAGDGVSLARHEVRLNPAEAAARQALVDAAARARLEGVEAQELARQAGADERLYARVARVLLEAGEVKRVGDRLVDAACLADLARAVRERWAPGSPLDVGAFKDHVGLSRRFAIPLLEYLDRERVTRRAGSNRVVLA
jgi:selenocysteine-specific elongation factor